MTVIAQRGTASAAYIDKLSLSLDPEVQNCNSEVWSDYSRQSTLQAYFALKSVHKLSYNVVAAPTSIIEVEFAKKASDGFVPGNAM